MSISSQERIEVQPQHSAGFRLWYISMLAVGIGIGAGLIAFLLLKLIGLFTNICFYHVVSTQFRSPQLNSLGLWVMPLTVTGGLIVGLMARYGSPKIRGHGIPEAMEAVLTKHSRIHPKVAVLKPLSVAIAIGTGGPFGAEGPIIQTGGAFGSMIGQLVRMTATERKVLLACGAAAGMSAVFNTPIAAVILAIELLLFEFKSRSFIPLVIASTLATATRVQIMDGGPMFTIGAVNFGIPGNLPYFLVLGVLCGLAAIGFSKTLYWVEDQFERLPFHEMWWPAIGGLALGVIGYFVPRVLGVGYDTISDILNDRLTWEVLTAVLVFKFVAVLVTIGSGTSGGILAPTFMTSAALGSVVAIGINHLIPSAHLDPAAFAIVAMGAVFGAASRATFTFIVFAFEITRDYDSVLPLMLVSVIASGIARRFMRHSIMTEKLARRGLRVNQEYEADVFQQVNVAEVMIKDAPTISADTTVAELADLIARGDAKFTRHHAMLILDKQNQLAGIITRGDVLRALEADHDGTAHALDAGNYSLIVAYPDETLHEAMAKMLNNNIGRLPVVERGGHRQHRLVGYLGRSEVMAARLQRHKEEHVREPGWLSREK